MFQKRVVKKLYGPKSEEMGGWIILHKEELHNLYASPNIVWVIKSKRIRLASQYSTHETSISAYKILFGNVKGRDQL
jgi:hypothetical protein